MCVFCKIIAGEIPSQKVYEDEEIVIFKDIEPKAKIHLLMVPKKHYPLLSEAGEEDFSVLARALKKLQSIKDSLGLADGYRLVINQGENAGQTVPHLHVHILGGETLPW